MNEQIATAFFRMKNFLINLIQFDFLFKWNTSSDGGLANHLIIVFFAQDTFCTCGLTIGLVNKTNVGDRFGWADNISVFLCQL